MLLLAFEITTWVLSLDVELLTDKAELALAVNARHMLAAFIFLDVDFALGTAVHQLAFAPLQHTIIFEALAVSEDVVSFLAAFDANLLFTFSAINDSLFVRLGSD